MTTEIAESHVVFGGSAEALSRGELVCAGSRVRIPLMDSDEANILSDPVARLLLDGRAATPSEAEQHYLEENLDEVLRLVQSPLSEEEFRRHPLITILFSHGSRGWEDSLR